MTTADSIRDLVSELPQQLLEPGQKVSQPVNPVLSHAATHGAKRFDDFLALKEHERRGTLGLENVEYGRYGNLPVQRCEAALARLDAAESCLLCNSGMSAINTVLYALLLTRPPRETGGKHHVIVGVEGYRKTREILGDLQAAGLAEVTAIPMDHFSRVGEYVRPNTALVFFETPSNPFLRVIDVAQVSEQVKTRNAQALVVVDHTFASPINQKPLLQGADVLVPSLTKYIGGHNTVIAGAILGSQQVLEIIRKKRGALGSIASEESAERVLQGIKTLSLRMERLNHNGMAVAEYLSQHPRVAEIWYPGLSSHPDHEIAARQMSGFGGVVTFRLKADLRGVRRFVDSFMEHCEDAWLAPSFGGTEAFVSPVAVVSHFQEGPELRRRQGITDDLVRFSVGIYDPESLQEMLREALAQL